MPPLLRFLSALALGLISAVLATLAVLGAMATFLRAHSLVELESVAQPAG